MSLPERAKRFELPQADPNAARPKIWIEGQQRPKFNIKAYSSASLRMAKRDLAPEILDAEQRLRGIGARVKDGELRLNLAWAGRMAQVVPSHKIVGRWITGLADLFAGSHAVLVPVEPVESIAAYPDLVRSRPVPSKLKLKPANENVAVHRPQVPEEPTLHAIRSAIRTAPQDALSDSPRREPKLRLAEPSDRELDHAEGSGLLGKLRQLSRAAGSRVLLGILMAFAIPGGAVKAMLFHLDGGDLDDWS